MARMTATSTITGRWPGRLRRLAGFALGAAVILAAALWVLAGWNPWRLAVLDYSWFGNPPLGLLVVSAAGLVASWLAFPTQDGTRQRWRTRIRIGLAVLAVLGLMVAGIFGNHFRFDTEQLALSPDGTRTAVLATDYDSPRISHLWLWEGRGLAARKVADLGRLCSRMAVTFVTDDLIELSSGQVTWQLSLDPATGTPLQVLGTRCYDEPQPARMGI